MSSLNTVEVLEREIGILQSKIALLEHENESLKAMILPKDWVPPEEFALTKYERIVLGAMYNKPGEVVTKENFFSLMYALNSTDETPQLKIIDVFICKLRKKLAIHDIQIETVWGEGYRISVETRDVLKNWDRASVVTE